MAGLAATFGRGAMTNHWLDIANSDCVMIIGSNAAENHPVSFRHVLRARLRGAQLLVVDPRYTRTAAQADVYLPLRPGTDIAFIGALINFALERQLIQRDYLLAHTNASFLVDPRFGLADGRFGPLQGGRYRADTWGYQTDARGSVRSDPTLKDPHCVFQVLKRHFSRYRIDKVARITGTPEPLLRRAAELFCTTGRPDRAGTILYAMGTTQHSHGTQNVRAYAILQLLLGNIGVAGGGINALRGESNVQGSTDHCLLSHLLPGYLKAPVAAEGTLADYLAAHTPRPLQADSANWWSHTPAYLVSLLKAWWGERARAENDFFYHYLPKRGGDCSYLSLFAAMERGALEGLIALGQNPAVSGPQAGRERRALEKLRWLVVADLWETETAAFWKRPGVDPGAIATEVFMLPAAAAVEKAGSITNSGRWAQWRHRALEPPGQAHSDLWIIDALARRLQRLYRRGGRFPGPIVDLQWHTGPGEEPDPQVVAREINGRFLRDTAFRGKNFSAGQQVPSFLALAADGSTACGNWLYSGSFPEEGNLMARRRASQPDEDPLGLQPQWAWCWPLDRRILYNRASCDARGRPWDPRRVVVRFDRAAGRWQGDIPDGGWPPLLGPGGAPDPAGKSAFIMLPEGRARLYAPGLADGPLPEHYEPAESPVANLLGPQRTNPLLRVVPDTPLGDAERFPLVATTYRVSEHWQAGAMTRNLPWLAELVPEAFVEIDRELAAARGISHGQRVELSTARGRVTMRALVTGRLRPLQVAGRRVHLVGLVWHFGYQGLVRGDSANLLTAAVSDPNSMIPEYKAFLCQLRPLPAGRTS